MTWRAPSFLLGSRRSWGVSRICTHTAMTGSRVPFLLEHARERKWVAATVGDTRSSKMSGRRGGGGGGGRGGEEEERRRRKRKRKRKRRRKRRKRIIMAV